MIFQPRLVSRLDEVGIGVSRKGRAVHLRMTN
jgi:hypothetical protein